MVTKILAYFIYVGVENPLRRQTAGVERFKDIKDVISELLDGRDIYGIWWGGVSSHYLEFAKNEMDRFNEEKLTLARERLESAFGVRNLPHYYIDRDVSNKILEALEMVPDQVYINRRPLREAMERLRRARIGREIAYSKRIDPESLLREIEGQDVIQWPTHEIPGLAPSSPAPAGFPQELDWGNPENRAWWEAEAARAAAAREAEAARMSRLEAMSSGSVARSVVRELIDSAISRAVDSNSPIDLGSVDGGGKKRKRRRTKKKLYK